MIRYIFTLGLLVPLVLCNSARGYTPESPDVQAMVGRARAYLEKEFGKNQHDAELGAVCLAALACFSHTANQQHPLIGKAVAQIREESQKGFGNSGHDNYSLGIALIMLGTIDPETYQQEVRSILNAIYKRQKPEGGWGYPDLQTGDTSQAQYACLGMWMAERQGIDVTRSVVERCCNWWMRTQNPDGAFGYQGVDPGSFNRVPQQADRMTASMTCAGVGSLYVCGELLGFIEDPKAAKRRFGLPPAFRPVVPESERASQTAVDAGLWLRAVSDGNNWITSKAKVENNGAQQQYYYMYAVERYWAFREMAIATPEKEPGWYNSGVDYLKKRQDADGSWEGGNGKSVDTAFAILFLLRSSKKTITRIQLEQGRLTGGKGLGADLTFARVDQNGKVVTEDVNKPVSELLNMIDDPKSAKTDIASAIPSKIVLPTDPKERSAVLARLRRMAINGAFEGRILACKTLGTVRDMESVPSLIFALSDPDHRVVRVARDSLQFMSRNKQDYGLVIGDDLPIGTKLDVTVVQAAQKKWTEWLLSVKPDAELLQ